MVIKVTLISMQIQETLEINKRGVDIDIERSLALYMSHQSIEPIRIAVTVSLDVFNLL